MMRMLPRVIVWAITVVLMAGGIATALPAYIDIQSGIIVGRGEEKLSPGKSYDDTRLLAVRNAKDNIMKVLERQPVDLESLESKTIGDYLADYPAKKTIVNSFLDSAKVIRENKTKDGKVEVTLLLEIDGPGGYKTMLARLTGKAADMEKTAPVATIQLDESVRKELRDDMAARDPGDAARAYNIILMPFVNSTEFGKVDIGTVLKERLIKKFKRERRFSFLSEIKSASVLSDNNFNDFLLRKADANTKVKLKGVDGLIDGVITQYAAIPQKHGIGGTGFLEMTFEIVAEVHILDAKSGRWIYYDTLSASVTDRMFSMKTEQEANKAVSADDLTNEQGLASKALNALSDKIESVVRNSFPLQGYVLKVIGDRVYINLTGTDGLKEGDYLNVYRIGDELVDPVSGEVIDRIRDRIGVLRVADAKETYTQCLTSETPLQQINPGDVVIMK